MHALTENFNAFLKKINPSQTYETNASSAYNSVKKTLENNEDMEQLGPYIFLQGSYKRETAIYTINDVDMVVLCTKLSFPGSGSGGRSYSRDDIFRIVAKAIRSNETYSNKVEYNDSSKCIKVTTSVRLDVLPVVRKKGHTDTSYEPVIMYDPNEGVWRETFARYHQYHCSHKNSEADKNFIPIIKVVKHLRDTTAGLSSKIVPSFYIECLLYDVDNGKFGGPLALAIPMVLLEIAQNYSPNTVYSDGIKSPCGDKRIFSSKEWAYENYRLFHEKLSAWAISAGRAAQEEDKEEAIAKWKKLLGDSYFPRTVS